MVADDEDVAGFYNLKHLVSLPIKGGAGVSEMKKLAKEFVRYFIRPDDVDDLVVDAVEGPLFSGNVEENNGNILVFAGCTWDEMMNIQGEHNDRLKQAYVALPQSTKDLIERQLAANERVETEEFSDWTACSMHFWRW